jgi:DNA-binding GntR family transcriptional regulator
MPFQYFQQLYSEFESVKGSQRDLPTRRLSDPVAYVIRKAILSGVLKPGSSIPERVLAQELNVSRTPVREALFVLQAKA